MRKGSHMTLESRRKISEASRGKKLSPETCRKISEALKGYPYKGHPCSEETKKKISEARKGKPHPQKKGADRKPRNPFTEEQRKRVGDAHRGLKHTDETKRKQSEAARGEKNHEWKGGISFRQYCPKFNYALKEEIREKFNRKCYLCPTNEDENGRRLDVHHCDYNKGQGCGQKWSLLPLCSKCHKKTNSNRHHWFNLLNGYWINQYIDFGMGNII